MAVLEPLGGVVDVDGELALETTGQRTLLLHNEHEMHSATFKSTSIQPADTAATAS